MLQAASSNDFPLSMPKFIFKEKINDKRTLEVYNVAGEIIGEIKAHTTYLHKSSLINVYSKVTLKKYKIKENELLEIFNKYTENLIPKEKRKIAFSEPKIYNINKNNEKIIENEVKEPIKTQLKGINKSGEITTEVESESIKFRLENLEPGENIVLRPKEGDDKSFTTENNRGNVIKDRIVRDNLMIDRGDANRVARGYSNILNFEKKWKGEIDDEALELAWSHHDKILNEIKIEWQDIRKWVSNQDPPVTIENWSNRKSDFLAWIGKDESQFLSVFTFIDHFIQQHDIPANMEIKEFMDLELGINKSVSQIKSTIIAFDNQVPKFEISTLEKIYKKVEQEQVFSIIQSHFDNHEILSSSDKEYEIKKYEVYKDIYQLIHQSNFEATQLRELIRDHDVLENKLDRFIVAEFQEAISKITFSSRQVKGINQSFPNTREAILDFEKKCGEFLKNLKNSYHDIDSPIPMQMYLKNNDLKDLSPKEMREMERAIARMEKLFDYYDAKVDQVKYFLNVNLRDIITYVNQKDMTENEAAGGLEAHKLINQKVFEKENLIQLISKEPKVKKIPKTFGVTGGAFIRACHAPLYQPQETAKRLDHFFEFVEQKRNESKDSNIIINEIE
ncbi:MAG: hypothetical protein Q8K60_06160 [Parachlamydiaceae bacterium]|nr:hypothetical protein [Parachlamydiaceae bacterium]